MTDEELTLLLYLNAPENPKFPYDVYDRFDLDEIDELHMRSHKLATIHIDQKTSKVLLCYKLV